MEPFFDERGNKYYMIGDKMYVKLVQKNTTKFIGKLTYNLNSGKANLIIYRTTEQKLKLGYLVSWFPIKTLQPDKIILVENGGEKIYYIEWSMAFFRKDNPWKFKPKFGYEEQMVIPDAHWNLIKESGPITI